MEGPAGVFRSRGLRAGLAVEAHGEEPGEDLVELLRELLWESGAAHGLGPAVGQGLHLHPGNAVVGLCDHEVLPFLVTACPYEAQDYLDSGEEQVDVVPMPDGVIAFIQDYVERHHVEEPFHKRKRKRADSADEAFARPPGWSPGRRGGEADG